MSGAHRGTYYPHIDGIRAFAVLSVLFYHVLPKSCTGGFIGVDVFFVLSGFLITNGLYKDLQKGEYSIARFYVRRIRRIVPAYSVMLLFTVLIGAMIYGRLDMDTLRRTAVSSIFFVSNIRFQNNSGYFDADVQSNPLLNMWSLSVEEQFYVFFPLLLAFVFTKRRKAVAWIFGGIFAASLILSSVLAQGGVNPTMSFYSLTCRAWELLAGSLLAFYPRQLKGTNTWYGLVALIILTAAFFLYTTVLSFPGLTALLPVLCAVVLVQYGHLGISKHILENPVTVFFGKISYSLYLYHWPVIVYARYMLYGEMPEPWINAIAIVLSFILAILSWKYVEMPIRTTRWKSSRYFILAASCFAVLFASTHIARQIVKKFPGVEISGWWNGEASKTYADPKFHYYPDKKNAPSFVVLGEDKSPQYLLWGDSHAWAASPGFNEFSKKYGINGLYVNRNHILLYHGYGDGQTDDDYFINNHHHLDAVMAWIREHPEIPNIILINRWALRCSGHEGEQPGAKERFYTIEGLPANTAPEQKFEISLTQLCTELKELGKNVIILTSVPEQEVPIPAKAKRNRYLGKDEGDVAIDKARHLARQKSANDVFHKLEAAGLVKVLNTDDFFYPEGSKPKTLVENNHSLYRDADHLTIPGAIRMMEHAGKQLHPLLIKK